MKLNPKLKHADRPSYWAVFWGARPTPEVLKQNSAALRMNSPKTTNPLEAAKYNFGLAAENMWVLNLGTNVAPLRRDKWLRDKFHSTSEWVRIGPPGVDCQNHWHCDPDMVDHNCKPADREKSCPYCGQEPRKGGLMLYDRLHAALLQDNWKWDGEVYIRSFSTSGGEKLCLVPKKRGNVETQRRGDWDLKIHVLSADGLRSWIRICSYNNFHSASKAMLGNY